MITKNIYENEIWKHAKGLPDYYKVSDKGRVYDGYRKKFIYSIYITEKHSYYFVCPVQGNKHNTFKSSFKLMYISFIKDYNPKNYTAVLKEGANPYQANLEDIKLIKTVKRHKGAVYRRKPAIRLYMCDIETKTPIKAFDYYTDASRYIVEQGLLEDLAYGSVRSRLQYTAKKKENHICAGYYWLLETK